VTLLRAEGREADDTHALSAMDEYLPLMKTLLESVKQSQQPFYLDSRMAFIWEGALNTA
jgi:hypothetical protein